MHPSTSTAGRDSLAIIKTQHPRFAAALEDGASELAALRQCGIEYWRRGRIDEAVQMLSAAAEKARNNPAVLFELGCVLRLQGRKLQAMQYFTASLTLDPQRVDVWLGAASLSDECGDKKAAERAYIRALALNPVCADAAAGLGLIYIGRHEYKEGAKYLELAVSHGAASAPLYACLAQVRYLLGEFAQSSSAFAEAIRGGLNDAATIQRYARARLTEALISSSFDEAIAVYHSAAGTHAEDIFAVCRMAFQALIGYGHGDSALRLGKALLDRKPGDLVIDYHVQALEGSKLDRAPREYVAESFNKYASHFDAHLVDVLGYKVPQKIHSLLVSAQVRFRNILDLGCGTGLAAPYLARFGGTLTGVDLSRGMLEEARERGLYSNLFEEEAISYLRRHSESFDLITALDVVPYFGDLAEFFEAAEASLKPGGIFALSFETSGCRSYELRASGRFAHNANYVASCGQERFHPVVSMATVLRYEASRPVEGRLVLLRRVRGGEYLVEDRI
ncbi:MAG TPA: methyltransferase domain-containing protein [Methylocella sp.]|nr:methyltransferase domain-containing protein [Methylocella sp.]